MFKKIAALATAAVLCAGLMAGCGASSTTADTSYSAENPLVLTLAHGLSETHKVMWDTAIDEAVKEAQETMGVEFVYDVDKEAFREATQPMIEAYENEYPGVKTLMDTIEAAREGE